MESSGALVRTRTSVGIACSCFCSLAGAGAGLAPLLAARRVAVHAGHEDAKREERLEVVGQVGGEEGVGDSGRLLVVDPPVRLVHDLVANQLLQRASTVAAGWALGVQSFKTVA